MRCCVILLAAGQGTRFRQSLRSRPKQSGPGPASGVELSPDVNKAFALLAGLPVWKHSLELFLSHAGVHQLVLVVAPGEVDLIRSQIPASPPFPLAIVAGGAERYLSVQNALAAVSPDCTRVCIHDAARPLLLASDLAQLFAASADHSAVILAAPVRSTLKRVGPDGVIRETVSRESLWEAQTPQMFETALIRRAHAAGQGQHVTDDAQLVERLGEPVRVVQGSVENLKLTTLEDWLLAESILASRRTTRPG